jgi:hypothetical protein
MPLDGIWPTLGRVGNIIGIMGPSWRKPAGRARRQRQPSSDRTNRPT